MPEVIDLEYYRAIGYAALDLEALAAELGADIETIRTVYLADAIRQATKDKQ